MQIGCCSSRHAIAALAVHGLIAHDVQHILERRIALLANFADNFLDGFGLCFGLDLFTQVRLETYWPPLTARTCSSATARHYSNPCVLSCCFCGTTIKMKSNPVGIPNAICERRALHGDASLSGDRFAVTGCFPAERPSSSGIWRNIGIVVAG